MSAAEDRALLIHAARVYLAEFRKRRDSHVNRNFIWTLFDGAQRSRRDAQKIRAVVQGDMFTGRQEIT